MNVSRRAFVGNISLFLLSRHAIAHSPATEAGRNLDFEIGPGFGDARAADIRAVLTSAGGAIWEHCPNTRWRVPGFHIYHSDPYPITLDAHHEDGRIAIGLTPQGPFWSQFAYQFAHEFGHALAGHSNDWQGLWLGGPKSNHWLEESICETASLFAMRKMGRMWETEPPYKNWKSYAVHLKDYAQQRLDETAKNGPSGDGFIDWFRANEASMRQDGALRDKNNVVAARLLPLFEQQPAGWEAVTFYNRVKRDPAMTLAAQFADWRAVSPVAQHAFIGEMATIFAVHGF